MSQSGNAIQGRTTTNKGELAAEKWQVPIEEKGARTQHERGSFECRELAVLLPIYIFALCLLGLSLLTFASTASADETTWTFNGPSWLTTHIAPPVEKHDRFESVDRLSDGRRVAVGTTVGDGLPPTRDIAVALASVYGPLDPTFNKCTVLSPSTCPAPGTNFFNLQAGGLEPSPPPSDDFGTDVVVRSGKNDIIADDAIFVVGRSVIEDESSGVAMRIDAAGALDPSFGDSGKVLFRVNGNNTKASAAGLQSDGKLVVGGTVTSPTGRQSFFVARFLENGSFDPYFGIDGAMTISFGFGEDQCDQANDLAVDASDRIILVGKSGLCTEKNKVHNVAIARVKSNGALDMMNLPGTPGFSYDGIVVQSFGGSTLSEALAVKIEPNGSILIAGYANPEDAGSEDEDAESETAYCTGGYIGPNPTPVPGDPDIYDWNCSGGLLARFSSLGNLQEGWDVVHPQIDFGQTWADLRFTDVGVLSTGHILATGYAKGAGGNGFLLYKIAANFIPDENSFPTISVFLSISGTGKGLTVLPNDSVVLVGKADKLAAIVQPTYETCGDGALDFDEECEAPFGACCDACSIVPADTLCRASDGVCDAAEFCNGVAPECPSDGFAAVETPCGDVGGKCVNQDSCDGAGSCIDGGFAAAETPCGDVGGECVNQDSCDGAGTCIDGGFPTPGTPCGDSTDTECRNPDICNGMGTCLLADELDGTFCGDAANSCRLQDLCLGGECVDKGFVPVGDPCDDSSDSECTDPDTCDGSGECLANDEPNGMDCGDDGTQCVLQDRCEAGSCVDKGFVPADAPCGNPASNECNAPDSCDGAGSCQPNYAMAGTPAPADCGDGDVCTDDECNGVGECQNFEPDSDGDTISDCDDNCIMTPNTTQQDSDSDAIGDVCDNCVEDCNPDQLDSDENCPAIGEPGFGSCGDACDACPGFDQENQTPAETEACNGSQYNVSNMDCCFETDSDAMSADPICTGGGDAILEVGGGSGGGPGDSPGGAGIKVPADCSNDTFGITSETKSQKQFWASSGPGTWVGAYDFTPDGGNFALCAPKPVVYIEWVDADDATKKIGNGVKGVNANDVSPYQFGIFENSIAVHWADKNGSGQQITDKCLKLACGAIGADGFPTDWNGGTQLSDPTLKACCDKPTNRFFFEVEHFSAYGLIAVEEDVCEGTTHSSQLRIVKLHKEGDQKVIFKSRLILEDADGFFMKPGARFEIQDRNGDTLWEHDASDPALESWEFWKSNFSTTAKLLAENADSGRVRILVKRKNKSDPNEVEVKIIATRADLPVDITDLPLTLKMDARRRFGFDATEVHEYGCSKTDFSREAGGICAMNRSARVLRCRD